MGRDEWVAAGLQAVAEGGLAAVAVEPLARRLGVTKGSFYWHFSGRDELVAAVVDHWEREASALPPLPEDPREALHALADTGTDFALRPTPHARLALETGDERVAAALRRVTDHRLRTLAGLYRELGLPAAEARARARLAYAAVLGLQRLQVEAPVGRRERPALRRAMHTALVPEA